MTSHLLLHLLQLGMVAVAAPPGELLVSTSSGTVKGGYNDSAQSVRAFLGIPYAKPPVGRLRFAPPQPKAPSSSVIDASAFGSPCPQIYAPPNDSIWSVLPYEIWNAADMSEDCLHLNIWAPAQKQSVRGQRSAVMMFVHGGGFAHGGASVSFYDGTNIVRDNAGVIVVTFNYRLNIFGFPNAPGLAASMQNVGLLDQRLAVEWVYSNIGKFGGDPHRILLFGQSAGAMSTSLYSYAYPDEPLVSAFGHQSGSLTMLKHSKNDAESNWNNLSTAIGCGSGIESLECMRTIQFSRVISTMAKGSYNFTPVVDNRTMFAGYRSRSKQGLVAHLPTLAGITAREFTARRPLSRQSVNEMDVFEETKTLFDCPLREDLRLLLAEDVPVWRYVYHGNFTNLDPTRWLGAYHSSEIPLVFGTYNSSTLGTPATETEIEASRYIQGAWVEFAQDPCNGLAQYGWPRYTKQDDALVNLALDDEPTAVFTSSDLWDSHCNGSCSGS